jgi:hypothetical protein
MTMRTCATIAAIAIALLALVPFRENSSSMLETVGTRIAHGASTVSTSARQQANGSLSVTDGRAQISGSVQPKATSPEQLGMPRALALFAVSALSVNPSEVFSLTLQTDVRRVQRIALVIRFDPELVHLTATQNGNFPSANDGSLNVQMEPDGASVGIVFEGRAVSGQGTIALLEFELVGPQPAEITLTTSEALDDAGLPIQSGPEQSIRIEPNIS